MRLFDRRSETQPSGRQMSDVKGPMPEKAVIIADRLRHVAGFRLFSDSLVEDICRRGTLEELEPGIVLFRQSTPCNNWYFLLSGSLDLVITADQSESVRTLTYARARRTCAADLVVIYDTEMTTSTRSIGRWSSSSLGCRKNLSWLWLADHRCAHFYIFSLLPLTQPFNGW
ncbi:unnamed protein product [Soboliphyme baturini]|uniref:Cyclic nucleotide-binding domain-containing protein n=1 Tax=Soboliphyme baturini TaxID=241478 RepID=A0A183IU43_9BILA|nr:unnamed protein product [Soboliphyme baturini]